VAILLSLISSLMWGASDFAGGLISRRHPAMLIVGMGGTFGFAIATAAVLVSGGWHGPYGWLPWGIAAGASGAAGLICYYLALATGTMGVVAPVTSLGVIVPVAVGIASGESPSTMTMSGVAIAMIGIVLTSGPEFSGGASAKPVLIAVAAGLFFGAFFVFLDRGADDSPILSLWTMRGVVAVAFVVVSLARRTTWNLSGRDYLWVLGISAGDLGANYTYGLASTKGYVSITSVLASLFPVVTVLLARVVLHERLRRVQIVGVVVTMVGVALISAG
jgi:drug/metabolite transporter (DMT)-like permease